MRTNARSFVHHISPSKCSLSRQTYVPQKFASPNHKIGPRSLFPWFHVFLSIMVRAAWRREGRNLCPNRVAFLSNFLQKKNPFSGPPPFFFLMSGFYEGWTDGREWVVWGGMDIRFSQRHLSISLITGTQASFSGLLDSNIRFRKTNQKNQKAKYPVVL